VGGEEGLSEEDEAEVDEIMKELQTNRYFKQYMLGRVQMASSDLVERVAQVII
jgi:hypothetical protein